MASAPTRTAVVGYGSLAQLGEALRDRATVVRAIPQLEVAAVQPGAHARYFATAAVTRPGIAYVEPVSRPSDADPALQPAALPGGRLEWQYAAARVDAVPHPSCARRPRSRSG